MFRNFSRDALGISGHQSELIELTLSYGFRAMELDTRELHERAQASSLDRARRLFDSAKLKMSQFQLAVELDASDADFAAQLEAARPYIELAGQVKCERALVTLSPGSDLRPYHENFELHRQRIAKLAELLAASNVRLGVGIAAAASLRAGKSFEFIHDFDALLVLVNMINAKNVGVHADLWQLVVGGGRIDDLKKLPVGKLVSVTLADLPSDVSAEQAEPQHRALPGETSAIDSAAALTLLAEMGYEGPVTPSVDRSQLAVQNREQIVKLASQKLDEIWKTAGLGPTGKLATAGAT